MIYKVAICDDEINQCAVLEKIIIEYFIIELKNARLKYGMILCHYAET